MTLISSTDSLRLINRVAGTYQPEPADTPVAETYLGTEVFDQLVFPKDGNEGIGLTEDLVINDVIFRVSRPKIIVKTPVQGRQGRVKEIVSLDDFTIEINGKLVSEYMQQRPLDQLRSLIAVESYEGSVAVAVNFLSLFSIDTILIEKINIEERRGYYNEVPFEIIASSDEPIELQVTA